MTSITESKSKDSNTSNTVIGDVIVKWIDGKFEKAYISLPEEATKKPFVIDGEEIIDVELVTDHNIVVFKTKEAVHFRHKNNSSISGSSVWSDYFIEPFTSSFYRKDERGFWYDIEGSRIKSTIILKGDVLVSLEGKASKTNQIFSGQKLIVSPGMELIQIGKVVLDKFLNPVLYYNDKITGLGKSSVRFENGIVYQQVMLGVSVSAFIEEKSKKPIKVNEDEVIHYNSLIGLGSNSYYVFSTEDSEVYINAENASQLSINEASYELDSESYLRIGEYDVVKVKTKSDSYFYNLTSDEPFALEALDNSEIKKVSKSNVALNKCELINVASKKKATIIRSDNLQKYVPATGDLQFEKIKNVPGFESIFAMVTILGKQQLFSLQNEELISLDNSGIVAIDGHSKNKLIGAVTSNGERIVIDLRNGFTNLDLANADGNLITQTEGEPCRIGSKVLQNVKIQTLGGVQERVIDLNSESLSIFQFPDDLMTYTDGEIKSVFAGLKLISIDFKNIIQIENNIFIKGIFRSYDDELHTVILNQESGRPLRMDGLGHKRELVTDFIDNSRSKVYNLGPHRMIGVKTLKEDLKKDELLFSINTFSSWLAFADGYLPIFKKVVEVEDFGNWNYHLFELRALSNDKEYIAVEQTSPHRLLVKKKGNKHEPIVVKSKEIILKSPEEISTIKKLFFDDPGILIDVYL